MRNTLPRRSYYVRGGSDPRETSRCRSDRVGKIWLLKTPPLHRIRDEVRRLGSYALRHRDCPVKLNQNESPFDVPPEIPDRESFCREFSAAVAAYADFNGCPDVDLNAAEPADWTAGLRAACSARS